MMGKLDTNYLNNETNLKMSHLILPSSIIYVISCYFVQHYIAVEPVQL
jgi:hypothetical protein